MDFTLFFLPVLRPFLDWCIISLSWYFTKKSMEEFLVKDKETITTGFKITNMVYICFVSSLIGAGLGIFIYGNFNLSYELAIVIPSLASCLWYMEKHNSSVLSEFAEKQKNRTEDII